MCNDRSAGLYLLLQDVTVCGKVTPVILHGVVSPDGGFGGTRRREDSVSWMIFKFIDD